ncbi:MAG: hypothetical protein JKY19_00345 [Alcanivoracaceae bacterium]|nr:hypothetical protein [Alcanivoracaceae bacterium]
MKQWRLFLCIMSLSWLLLSCNTAKQQSLADDWQIYKDTFMHSEGAIVDSANQNVRHTEAQGIGLLLAVANNDKAAFLKIWQWTQKHLQIHTSDKLFAWRWRTYAPHVPDMNNASDGDILIAWSLLRASQAWGDDSLRLEAENILHDIKQLLVVKHSGYTLLLPGQKGFRKKAGVNINLSYWVFPALYAFQDFQPKEPLWGELITSGLRLIEYARFGAWQMPPDWLMVRKNDLKLAKGFPRRFGLDAVRIPLYLIWAGHKQHSAVLRANHFWKVFSGHGAYPGWLSLDDTLVHLSESMGGVEAIAQLTRTASQQKVTAKNVSMIPLTQSMQYYHASLLLLSKLAWQEMPRE